jgi:hypothetical protein
MAAVFAGQAPSGWGTELRIVDVAEDDGWQIPSRIHSDSGRGSRFSVQSEHVTGSAFFGGPFGPFGRIAILAAGR